MQAWLLSFLGCVCAIKEYTLLPLSSVVPSSLRTLPQRLLASGNYGLSQWFFSGCHPLMDDGQPFFILWNSSGKSLTFDWQKNRQWWMRHAILYVFMSLFVAVALHHAVHTRAVRTHTQLRRQTVLCDSRCSTVKGHRVVLLNWVLMNVINCSPLFNQWTYLRPTPNR